MFRYSGDQGFATSIAAACLIVDKCEIVSEDFNKVLETGMELYCKMIGAAATNFLDGSMEHARVMMGKRGDIREFLKFSPFQKLFKNLRMYNGTFALTYYNFYSGFIKPKRMPMSEVGHVDLKDILGIVKNMSFAILRVDGCCVLLEFDEDDWGEIVVVFDPNGHEGSGSLSLKFSIADFMEKYVYVKFGGDQRYELLPLGIQRAYR